MIDDFWALTRRSLVRFWPYLVVTGVFIAARVVYWVIFRIRFDHSPVAYFIQYLHPWFIEHDFWRSVLYLHQQAPLQNVMTGGLTRLLGATTAFELLRQVYVVLGLVSALTMLHVMLRLGAARWLAAAAVALYTASPVTVLYENWLFYHLPVAVLLMLSLVALLRYYRSGTRAAGFCFFGLFVCAGLFYTIFHPILVVVTTLALLIRPPLVKGRPSPRLRTVGMLCIPLFVMLLNLQKTRVLTGHGQGSAFLWENLAVKTYNEIPVDERQWLVDSGFISRASGLALFPVPLSRYATLRIPHEPTGVPLLDMGQMPDGQTNPHSLEKVLIAEKYYKNDTFYLLKHRFPDYWRGVVRALTSSYFTSPFDYDQSLHSDNREKLRDFNAILNRMFLADDSGRQLLLVVLFPMSLLYGIYRVFGARSVLASERASVVVIAHMGLIILFITASTVLISVGDFSRYRFNIDPFYLILIVLMATEAGQRAALLRRHLVARLKVRGQLGTLLFIWRKSADSISSRRYLSNRQHKKTAT